MAEEQDNRWHQDMKSLLRICWQGCGYDVVVLVIAADEGVMPQTGEHLNISLLQDKGIIVLLRRIWLMRNGLDDCRAGREEVQGLFSAKQV